MTPPLPAASRPSKMTTTRSFLMRTHSWSFTSSFSNRSSSAEYFFLVRRLGSKCASRFSDGGACLASFSFLAIESRDYNFLGRGGGSVTPQALTPDFYLQDAPPAGK